jgi:hypothetical protein
VNKHRVPQRVSATSLPRHGERPHDLRVEKYGRYWAVYDAHGVLVVVTVYKKGALEVIRRLEHKEHIP